MSRARTIGNQFRLEYNEHMVALCVAQLLTQQRPQSEIARRWRASLEIYKLQCDKLRNKIEKAETWNRRKAMTGVIITK